MILLGVHRLQMYRMLESIKRRPQVEYEPSSNKRSRADADVRWRKSGLRHCDCGLLRAICEVVVPGAGEKMLANLSHLDKSSIEMRRSPIELSAVGKIIVVIGFWIARYR